LVQGIGGVGQGVGFVGLGLVFGTDYVFDPGQFQQITQLGGVEDVGRGDNE
jgi:hypothetical protein